MTTTTTLSQAMTAYYERMLLERLRPNLIHGMWGQAGRIARGQGVECIWRDYGALALATTPLVQGVTPAGQDLSASKISVICEQFGDYVKLSDMVQTQVIDPVLEEAVSLLGEQCGQTVDVLCREVLNAGTNVRYAGGVANMGALTTSHKLTAAEARKAKLQLEVAKVPSFGGYYHAFIHPNAAEDLKDDPRWISAQGTMDPEALRTGLLGELDGVKYYKSPNCKVYDGAGQNGIDVYSTLFFGRGAYGVVSYEAPEIGGIDPAMAGGEQQFALPVQIIVHQLGSAGSGDPLNQRATMGWKIAYATKILRQVSLVRVLHTSTYEGGA